MSFSGAYYAYYTKFDKADLLNLRYPHLKESFLHYLGLKTCTGQIVSSKGLDGMRDLCYLCEGGRNHGG